MCAILFHVNNTSISSLISECVVWFVVTIKNGDYISIQIILIKWNIKLTKILWISSCFVVIVIDTVACSNSLNRRVAHMVSDTSFDLVAIMNWICNDNKFALVLHTQLVVQCYATEIIQHDIVITAKYEAHWILCV